MQKLSAKHLSALVIIGNHFKILNKSYFVTTVNLATAISVKIWLCTLIVSFGKLSIHSIFTVSVHLLQIKEEDFILHKDKTGRSANLSRFIRDLETKESLYVPTELECEGFEILISALKRRAVPVCI